MSVIVSDVTKRYVLHHEKPTFIENVMLRGRSEVFTALHDISFTVARGEKVGIIGHNGSGKTTLLKLIAGITVPTAGTIKTRGKVVSLIELGAGFHPDLTGEENIFLSGLIVGMTRDEIKKKYKKIIAFADIDRFIDAPLFTYSDGMKLRLGFAIAAHADPDILILDEGLSAGDADFQQKSARKIEEFFQKNKTILMVSHWLDYIRERCEKIIWLDQGHIREVGDTSVIDHYVRAQTLSHPR